MGLGKTVQTIKFVEKLVDLGALSGNVAVVLPHALMSHWFSEIHKWYPTI